MRGQAHTVEAFAAAVLLVSGLVFATQAAAVTPLSASTSNQQVETQQRATANTLLAAADANDSLRQAVLDWNASANGWNGTGASEFFTRGGPPNAFGETLNETFVDDRVAVNVVVSYRNNDTTGDEETLVYMGTPSDNAVAASHTITIYDDDHLRGETTNVSAARDDGQFYMPDAARNGTLFNVAEVEVVAWQM